jgi:outer membrane protein TolC
VDILETIKAKATELAEAKAAVKNAKAQVAAIRADIRAARKAFADALRGTPGKARGPRKARAPKEAKPAETV